MVGKYGALVAFKKTEGGTKEFRPADIGRRLCQHIVGMSPVTIGEFAEVKPGNTCFLFNCCERKNKLVTGHDFIKPLQRKLLVKQKLVVYQSQQCKLYGLLAGNQFLLRNSCLCLASFWANRLYGIGPCS